MTADYTSDDRTPQPLTVEEAAEARGMTSTAFSRLIDELRTEQAFSADA